MVERLQSFQLPHPKEVEVVLIRLPDGRIVARTAEEVEAMEGEQKEGGGI